MAELKQSNQAGWDKKRKAAKAKAAKVVEANRKKAVQAKIDALKATIDPASESDTTDADTGTGTTK